MSLVADLRDSRELLVNLTRREVKGKYKRTALGQLWSLANPLAQMLIFTVVFSFIIRMEPDAGDPSGLDIFALWLMCALLPWTFFTAVVNGGMSALVGNENLIKKVYFPRSTLVVASTFSAVYQWSIEMAVLAVVLVLVGSQLFVWLPLVIVFMVLLACFSLGIAFMLSVANVYFRDTQHFVAILLQIWFYLTPIVYPVRLVAEQSASIGPLFGSVTVLDLYELNPMGRFAEVFRNLMYDNRMPDLGDSLWCVIWSVAALMIGAWVFNRHTERLAEVL
ncbi:ABC transporter permease [Cellulomonas sp. Root137]|uniref:ABC transporter permease n=1 Tax=Cellulomonas sp. Root137 TaxID=1736459 RepID=UPI0006FC177C|nr:ABC transporter permease [Cellulomonas sp. Root137]KQY48236.1 ABC transporter [Cellulomonas sp. Root137]